MLTAYGLTKDQFFEVIVALAAPHIGFEEYEIIWAEYEIATLHRMMAE